MAYSVTRSAEFTGQLSQTVEYVHGTLCSPRAAKAIVDELDIALVEDYMALFKKNDFMFDILQREVL